MPSLRPSRLYGALSLVLASAAHGAVQPTDRFLVVDPGAAKSLPAAETVADYGRFRLVRLDGAAQASSAALPAGAKLVDNAISFEAGAYDPLAGRFAAPARSGFLPVPATAESIELVQFAGPIADAWERRLHRSGLTVLQYIPNNAYLVLADAKGRSALANLLAGDGSLRIAETLQPIYKLDRTLATLARSGLSAQREQAISVTLARHAGNTTSKARIDALARGKPLSGWSAYGALEVLSLRVRETDIETLARLPDVVAVERHLPRERMDEVQDMILAGELDGSQAGPSGPGYLSWLAAHGFSTTPSDYPIVAVVDDGVGNGSTTLGAGDPTLTVDGANTESRLLFTVNCTADASADGGGGHGHINTSIVGGYDTRTGFPFEDPDGFLRGLGVNPYARLGHAKIFANAGSYDVSNCGGSDTILIRNTYLGGARISSNSWGAGVNGDYTSDSAIYDAATRDADGVAAGLQPMIFVFAAGNDGAGASTIGSPGTAKNVITVGAAENDRPADEDGSWTDLCAIDGTGADNAMDVISFSSRGPAEGGRVKPELIAPGTHVQGTASPSPAYDGSGVCDQYRPSSQTTFAASSGTSHSTPAVAGLASLAYRFLETEYALTPSPAMMKAYLMAHPTYLTGVSANDSLPSNSQGYGMPNLGQAFDTTLARFLVDQDDVLTATGEEFNYTRAIVDSGKPTRIALAWSDAPGAAAGNPQVNNLDLEVTVGGTTYRGNVFSGAFSSSGGSADSANNYEAVFLPAGTSGTIDIRVVGSNIAGDGLPGDADGTDQDFALVCSNCSSEPTFNVSASVLDASTCGDDVARWDIAVDGFFGYAGTVGLSTSGLPLNAVDSYSPASGAVPLASTLEISTANVASGSYAMTVSATDGSLTRTRGIALQHSAALAAAPTLTAPGNGATAVETRPQLQWSAVADASTYVVEISTSPGFASLTDTATVDTPSYTPGTTLAASTRYYWRVRSVNGCGTGTDSPVFSFTTAAEYCATPGLAIPDASTTGIASTITVPAGTELTDLDVSLDITHTWMGDVVATLSRNGGTPRVLVDRPGKPATTSGCSGNDANIVLDDEGTDGAVESACGNDSAPSPGYPAGARLTPNETLDVFDGQTLATTWTLTVSDNASFDTGTLNRWCLLPTQAAVAVSAAADGYATDEDAPLTVAAPGVLDNDAGTGLEASIVTPPARGMLELAVDGGFVYTPAANDCGSVDFVYQASDGSTQSQATATLAIACLNDAPVAVADAASVATGGQLSVAAPGVLGNDSDIEDDSLEAVLVSAPAHAASFQLKADGSYDYTHNGDSAASDSFSYRASDTQADSDPVQVTISLERPDAVFHNGFE